MLIRHTVIKIMWFGLWYVLAFSGLLRDVKQKVSWSVLQKGPDQHEEVKNIIVFFLVELKNIIIYYKQSNKIGNDSILVFHNVSTEIII